MVDDTLRHRTATADYRQREAISRPDRSVHELLEPLNPVVGWTIALLVSIALWWGLFSLALWWGLWMVVSSLVPALLS